MQCLLLTLLQITWRCIQRYPLVDVCQHSCCLRLEQSFNVVGEMAEIFSFIIKVTLTNLHFICPPIRHTSGNSGTNSSSLTQHWCHIWWAWAITNRTITREDPRTLVVLQVKDGTPGGGTLVMTLGESVECQCTTDFTCLIMEMRYGGELYSILFVLILSFLSVPHG